MKLPLILTILLGAIAIGCHNQPEPTTQAQGTTGELRGSVALYDPYGHPLGDKSGVIVQLEGTSYSAISDSAGMWIIHDIPSEVYSISFSKNGFGIKKNTNYTYITGDSIEYPDTIKLYQSLACSVFLDSVSVVYDSIFRYDKKEGYQSGRITGLPLADSTEIAVYIFFGYSSTIDPFDTSTYIAGSKLTNPSLAGYRLTKNGSDLKFEYDQWEICGPTGWMQHGRTVYLQAFVFPKRGVDYYYDQRTKRWVLSSPLPASEVKSVLIP